MAYLRAGKWYFNLFDPQCDNDKREFGPYEDENSAEIAEVEADAMWDVDMNTESEDACLDLSESDYDNFDEFESEEDDDLTNDITDQNDESVVPSSTNQTQENTNTMEVNKDITPAQVIPAKFNAVTLTFKTEREYHDVVAALAAYGRKQSGVSGSSIKADFNLTSYSGNARRTVNELLTRLP